MVLLPSEWTSFVAVVKTEKDAAAGKEGRRRRESAGWMKRRATRMDFIDVDTENGDDGEERIPASGAGK